MKREQKQLPSAFMCRKHLLQKARNIINIILVYFIIPLLINYLSSILF